MKNIKLKLEYDGANYCGWQKQKNEKFITLQGTLEKAISNITKEKIEVIGASRTDSGSMLKDIYVIFLQTLKYHLKTYKK